MIHLDIHNSFLNWVFFNYMPKEQKALLDEFTMTGAYPANFVSYWKILMATRPNIQSTLCLVCH